MKILLKKTFTVSLLLIIVLFGAIANLDLVSAQVVTTGAGLTTKVAPGEFLPVSVKLSNFGGGNRVDVLVQYVMITKSGESIYSASETVAVETTNNFVKILQIPSDTAQGEYAVRTLITYNGQLVPATSDFTFRVETKILGVFRSEFMLYSTITAIIIFLVIVLAYILIRKRNLSRLTPFDYADIPKQQRAFYELISDTIMQMRYKVGDSALQIAQSIKGLKIDGKSGRVLQLNDSPSQIVAQLVAGYEKILGKNVSFSFRNDKNKRF